MNEYVINILELSSLLTIVALSLVLVRKMSAIKQLRASANDLRKMLDEMDEQAKIIVRTDMELNKAQEELDKKVLGLYALQRLSRVISTTLQEKQIFKEIEASNIEDLGFEKALAFLWNDAKKEFSLQLNVGYREEELDLLKAYVASQIEMLLNLIKHGRKLSTISAAEDNALKTKINQVFKVNAFVLAPISPQEGDKGLLFVGSLSQNASITEGDEELVTILANQLGESLENARLFEKSWHAQQELENKVEERTRQLTEALNEVKKISKRKTDFISSVSHELRTPLTSVKGYASILLAGKLGEVPAEIQERLGKINKHTDELVSMVNDLLDIARIESGKMVMEKESVELKSIVENVSDLLSVQLKNHQIEFSAQIADGASIVFADRRQIERVLINLIGNAIKFTPPQGKITLSSQKIQDEIQININDTGCGIPEEAQELIFEEFYRVDNAINEEVKGTGLGLSLVKLIVQAHNGSIRVKSKVGQGSTFSFTLPKTQ